MPTTIRNHPVWSSLFGVMSVFGALMFVDDFYAWFSEKYHTHQPAFAFVAFMVIIALVVVVIRIVGRHDSRDAELQTRVTALEKTQETVVTEVKAAAGLLGLICDKLQITRKEEKEATQ